MNSMWFLIFISLNLIQLISSDDEVFHWNAEIYPNLTSVKEAKFCTGYNRNPPSSVCDPDLILRKDEALRLDLLIDDVKNETKCFCDRCPPNKRGLNIKLALVKFVKHIGNVSLDRSVEMFAERTRRKWRYGEDCGNDVLIFFAALDDKIYISLGPKGRRIFNDDDIKELLAQTRAHFTSGNYHQGLESIIASLQDMSDYYSNKAPRLGTGSIILIVVCVSLVIIIVLLGVVWFLVKKERKTLRGSFEFIGSWGRNRNKTKNQSTPRIRPKIDPIYQPVHTNEKTEISDTTLPLSDKI